MDMKLGSNCLKFVNLSELVATVSICSFIRSGQHCKGAQLEYNEYVAIVYREQMITRSIGT